MEGKESIPLEWDSEVDTDTTPFGLFPAGTEVDYEVTALEKTRSSNGKFPQAQITLRCTALDGKGQTQVNDRLTLNTASAWKLGEFFRSIGQRKHGESIKPDWNAVVGATGRATLGTHSWADKQTGEQRTANDVKRYLYPPEQPVSAAEQGSVDPANPGFA